MAFSFRAALAGAAFFAAAAGSAEAQYAAGYPYPVASMYVPPPHGIFLPPSVRVDNPHWVPSTYYPIPNRWIGYADPSTMIVAPARVSYGVFGRTYVRTPYYRVGFW
jgi:hypothetical protein